jgi:hypothetical protein
MIPALKLLVVGCGASNQSESYYLQVYEVVKNSKGLPEVKVHSPIKKESPGKVIEVGFSHDMLSVLSSDGKVEFYEIIFDTEVLLKKMVKQEKRRQLKRKKVTTDPEEEAEEKPTEKKVDKQELKDVISKRNYDFSLHFSKKASILDIESSAKPRSMHILKGHKLKLHCFVSVPNKNAIYRYTYDTKE